MSTESRPGTAPRPRTFFGRLNVRNKMLVITLGTSVLALVASFVAYLLYDLHQLERKNLDELQSLAQLIGNRSTAAITFNDATIARENLQALEHNSAILLACIYKQNAELLASYAVADAQHQCPAVMGEVGYRVGGHAIDLVSNIELDNTHIGGLYLHLSREERVTRITNFFLAIGLIVLCAVIIITVVAGRLQRYIAEPVARLRQVALDVAQHSNYSVRADKHSTDELGDLVDSFNSMLDTIQHQNQSMVDTRRDLEQTLKQKTDAEERLASILRSAPDAVITINRKGHIETLNRAACRIFGYDSDALMGRSINVILPALQQVMQDQTFDSAESFEHSGTHQSGMQFPIEVTVSRIATDGGVIYTLILRDITERKLAEKNIQVLTNAVDQSPAAVAVTDDMGNVQYVNAQFTDITGFGSDEVLGQRLPLLNEADGASSYLRQIKVAMRKGENWSGELRRRHKNGSQYWEHALLSPVVEADGTVSHFIQISEDVSLRKQQEELLVHQANYDALTGLPNRVLALDRLDVALKQAHRENLHVALMFLDLDRFKMVNDTLGHEMGDKLLIEAAHRIQDCVREGSTVARFGGDEFVIILPNLHETTYAELVAHRVLQAFKTPLLIDEQTLYASTSIGIALYPQDGEDQNSLLKHADAAMYRAKERDRGAFHFFTQTINEEANQRLKMETHLRQALQNDEFYLVYQPVMDLRTQQIVSAEALIRWENPELGQVRPDHFISIAEETGLIVPIGDWVLETACKQMSQMHTQGAPRIKMAINVSFKQFKDGRIINSINQKLLKYKLPANMLELEVTERLLIEDDPHSSQTLDMLHDLGVQLSIDDFGTGYSALSYLQKFPFDIVKIDRAFINGITEKADDAALCEAIISMAHSLRLSVIAEGVESQAQLRQLQKANCDMAQGFYFAKPMRAEAFTRFVSSRHAS